jgi:hypothetical protein
MRIMVLGGKPLAVVLGQIQREVEGIAITLREGSPYRAQLLELAGLLLTARGIAERPSPPIEVTAETRAITG